MSFRTVDRAAEPKVAVDISSHASIQQVGDILIIKIPTATLQIPLPKIVSVSGIVETVQVSSTLQEERQVDLIAQAGRFQVRDVDHNLLFDYQETGTQVTGGLQPAAEISEANGNVSTADSLFGESMEEPPGHGPHQEGSSVDGIDRRQEDAVTTRTSALSLFLGKDSPTLKVDKRKVDSQATSHPPSTPPPRKRPQVVGNDSPKPMPADMRYSNRSASWTVTPRSRHSSSGTRASSSRRGSASSTGRKANQSFIHISPSGKTPKPRTTDHSSPRSSQPPHTPPSRTPCGATPPTASTGTHGVATKNKTPTNNVSPSATPKGFNSHERLKGKQALIVSWKGMVNYNPNAQRKGSSEQFSPNGLDLVGNIQSYPHNDDRSPTPITGSSCKGANSSGKARAIGSNGSARRRQDANAKETHSPAPTSEHQQKENLPTWMLRGKVESTASACTNSGDTLLARKVKKDKVNQHDGKTCLGNRVGWESKGQRSHSTPTKGKENRIQHNAEAATREVTSLSSSVFTIQGANWAASDNEGRTYDFTRGLPISHPERSCVSSGDANISKSSSTRKAPAATVPLADALPYDLIQQAEGSVLEIPPEHRAPKITGP
ncbi:MAG: hypothetical protein Q9208_000612 [Pyrenodesmia sp. 3 TL-2023]